ncbi:TetR/AcrR family transcriptional regulator [Nocardioides sp.]|uniref:TetR/AcrR family transcriptional regulator n=1 Tax=Nocardioides sp. TaxID=35761 RepID=UPI002722E956|nr:TetR/AcrR family transcriptional regulator [Nocardioides sp.]MDO9454848.1 helix-turn-helix domain-containing protein [Nocardioides sp.]
MTRWTTDARSRLERAAVDLYLERGYAETTVAALAERAGLTERTYFRHFPDKREVLFANEETLRAALAAAVAEAPDGDVRSLVRAGLDEVARRLQPRHAELVRRGPIVAGHPDLQERELIKLASWTTTLRDAVVARGVDEATAALAAAVGIAVLDVAARRWLAGTPDADLVAGLHDALAGAGDLLGA